jgi:hypothetical protein
MMSSKVTDLLAAWQEHQLTDRELVTEARQLTAEDRNILSISLQQTLARQQAAGVVSS